MALNFKISTNLRDIACDAITNEFDQGTGVATIPIRDGAIPATVATASSGTLLGTPTMNATSFGASSVGVCTAAAIISDTNAAASGDAGYFRIYQGAAGDTAGDCQGTAGEAADTTDMTFDNKTIVAGGTIAISAMTITVPIQ